MELKGYKIGEGYSLVNIDQLGDKKRYDIYKYGERFLIGQMVLHIRDNKKSTDHWFVFDSYNVVTGSFYKYVYRT